MLAGIKRQRLSILYPVDPNTDVVLYVVWTISSGPCILNLELGPLTPSPRRVRYFVMWFCIVMTGICAVRLLQPCAEIPSKVSVFRDGLSSRIQAKVQVFLWSCCRKIVFGNTEVLLAPREEADRANWENLSARLASAEECRKRPELRRQQAVGRGPPPDPETL